MKYDNVDKPKHYNMFSVEVKYTIAEWVAGYKPYSAYCIGNVLKYISRAPYKENMIQDLKKAKFYLEEVIELMEKEGKEYD